MVLPPGHHLEVTTKRSFSAREKWTLRIVGAGVAVFAVVLVIALAGPSQNTTRGCVDVSIRGATGGAAIHQCGANARALCRSAALGNGNVSDTVREIKAACRKDGFPVG
ncbi:MAG TPA: hypothetical protein VG294_02315 [Solirubrobacteraceae bacterium]|jgi:hypothetical protein|nr:hypothetical protein [Solirubrobacteraceae bacterium]